MSGTLSDCATDGVRDLVGRLRPRTASAESTALVLIDLQNLDASRTGLHGRQDDAGMLSGYFDRIEQSVMPAVHELQAGFRRLGIPTIYTTCASRARSLRDNGRRFRDFGIRLHESDEDAKLLPGLTVAPTDIILAKTTASAFWSTPLDRILRQMRIETLVIGGVVTSGCVESLVRDGCDLDYDVIVIPEACADRTGAGHEDSLQRMRDNFARLARVNEVLDAVKTPSRS